MSPRLPPDFFRALAPVLGLCACASTGRYVWVDDLPAPQPAAGADGYVIRPGDLLGVRVWNQDAMSAKARVRPDGRISLPFLGDVVAAGYSPGVLGQQLQTRLKDFVNVPMVTLTLEEERAIAVPVLGEVARPGIYSVEPGAGLLPAIAAAGGPNSFASSDRVFVLRPGPQGPVRIRFRMEALLHAEGAAALFRLQNGDQVVVE